ncbi:hypothetical protein CVT23_20880 [Minwuia thermotolerans]|uniref:Uncharacterized protein n=1 Tax=Minwuia thermotolerans TaxID=2056226 RepID=A0A2M9FW59_9PROT|nr:hypothetical protein CVT23_20880 [Minwuia thermotolerans]
MLARNDTVVHVALVMDRPPETELRPFDKVEEGHWQTDADWSCQGPLLRVSGRQLPPICNRRIAARSEDFLTDRVAIEVEDPMG